MKLYKIFSFLTYPEKHNADAILPSGTEIEFNAGKLCKMLSDIFDRSVEECSIPILFSASEGQSNVVRDELVGFVKSPSVKTAQAFANRLQSVTTKTSGMGLLFICIGKEKKDTRVVISRFPADEGVVAEKSSSTLTVQFVEQVFLKSAFSYKAAMFQDTSTAGFWMGSAVDKQINHGSKAIADYWIIDFLQSDFKTTSAWGTKRLATALKQAIKATSDVGIKHQIAACVQLANNMSSKAITISEFCEQFHLSPSATELICKQINPAKLLNEKFKFDKPEFNKHISYKWIELDNGAVLSAQIEKFDTCFKQTPSSNNSTTFVTTGQVIDEKLRTTK